MAATLALAPAAARACNNPELSVSSASAGPGDTIYWAISDAQPGAEYQVSVNGRIVQPTTTVTEPKPNGSFVMQDYGDRPLSITVSMVVSHDHEGGPWADDDSVQYRPPSAPGVPSLPAPEAPAEAPATPDSGAQGDRAPAEPVSRRNPSAPRAGRPKAPERSRSPSSAPRTTRRTTEPSRTAATPVSATAPESAARTLDERAGELAAGDVRTRASKESENGARGKRGGPASAPGRVRERARPGPLPAPRAVPQHERASPLALSVLGMLALAVCLAALVVMLLRRRGGESAQAGSAPAPVPPDVVIEAELQEIVAEERLRLLHDEQRQQRMDPGEPIRAGPP